MDWIYSVLWIIFFLPFSSQFGVSVFTASDSLSPSNNRTIVSRGEVFELGFFNPDPSSGDRWYIGIWYKREPETERSYVWVANRDNPLKNVNGTLKISGNNLFIGDPNHIWSTRIAAGGNRESPVAELLDSGNLVLRRRISDDDNFLWQSFDHPTDTLLPGMKLGTASDSNRVLKSWKSPLDPSTGNYTLKLQTQDAPGLSIIYNQGNRRLYWSGPWNGQTFLRVPRIFNVTSNSLGETTCSYMATNNISSRLVLVYNALLIQYTWNQREANWDWGWTAIKDVCNSYNNCGDNSYCDAKMPSTLCTCIEGYEPSDVTYGCVKKPPFTCGADKFFSLYNMSFPHDLKLTRDYSINDIKGCKDKCIRDCNCTAFSVTNSLQFNTSSCVIWRHSLVDLSRYSNGGIHLYLKQEGRTKKKMNIGVIVGLSLGIPAVFLFSLAMFCYWKRRRALRARASEIQIELAPPDSINDAGVIVNPPIPPMDFGTILQATDTFSHEIGHGGLGKVYKGRLLDGREIAVKRLSKTSRQGMTEFTSEVMLISRFQHINLVSLLGWSIHEEEMVLVYELLENGNLETHLFGRGQSSLDWETRFEIIKGIARGLSYLHEDSRVMAIHRDLKPSNILLDKDMIPKISDFGLARTENEANTKHAAGTHGYMAPEYAVSGRYSNKSDVFAFGVMVLEIVTGKKNSAFSYQRSDTNFLSFVWQNWRDNKWRESIEGSLLETSQREDQVQRCLLIGLGCVQRVAEDRPKISLVVSQLENDSLEVPDPRPPGFYSEEDRPTSSKHQGESSSSASVNRRTLTEISGR